MSQAEKRELELKRRLKEQQEKVETYSRIGLGNAKETFGRIGLFKRYRNLQSYWTIERYRNLRSYWTMETI